MQSRDTQACLLFCSESKRLPMNFNLHLWEFCRFPSPEILVKKKRLAGCLNSTRKLQNKVKALLFCAQKILRKWLSCPPRSVTEAVSKKKMFWPLIYWSTHGNKESLQASFLCHCLKDQKCIDFKGSRQHCIIHYFGPSSTACAETIYNIWLKYNSYSPRKLWIPSSNLSENSPLPLVD